MSSALERALDLTRVIVPWASAQGWSPPELTEALAIISEYDRRGAAKDGHLAVWIEAHERGRRAAGAPPGPET